MDDTRQGIRLRYVWGIWVLLGLFSACRLYVRGNAVADPTSFASSLLLAQVNAHIYFLATIPVLSYAGRFPPWRGNRPARVLLHALGGVVFSAAALAAQAAFELWFEPAVAGAVTPYRVAVAVLDGFGEGVCVYWLAVLAPYAYAQLDHGRGALEYPPLEDNATSQSAGRLRAQLRPHFLFNTLNSIAALLPEDGMAAESMLMSTSAFLRGVLSESREVSLKFELDTLKGYLQMEAACFEDELSIRVDVDPAAEQALIPNMLLLPLAENAIKHGSARSAHGRWVEVEARREGDRLRIQMSNNCEEDVSMKASPQPGTGLTVTGARLLHLYGPFHRFEARYMPVASFLVDIEIPFRVHRPTAESTGEPDESAASSFSG
jgi:two-component system, LytTR family, sensor kinase